MRSRRYGRRLRRRLRRRWLAATPQQRQTARVTAGSAALGLVVAVTAVAAAGPWDSGQRTAELSRAAEQGRAGTPHGPGGGRTGISAAPRVLTPLGSGEDGAPGANSPRGGGGSQGGGRTGGAGPGSAGATPVPERAALADTLEPLLKDGGLGRLRTGSVLDVTTGRRLFGTKQDTPATPASTVKLATATAALSAAGPDSRISTRTVRGQHGEVVLVGGGDPTLSARGLDALARSTAHALRGHGGKTHGGGHGADSRRISLRYDTSLYSGRTRHPIGTNDNIAPVTPLMVDEGRKGGSGGAPETSAEGPGDGPSPRSADPAADAAHSFAEALRKHGVRVSGAPHKAQAPRHAPKLAVHRSAPLSALVERMLTHSDNDIAEALARRTALAAGEPASFAGGAKAVRGRLDKLRLPLHGVHLADGSGLDRHDKVTASLLSRLLVRAAAPERAGLRAVLTGLPVAHFTGTLDGRYKDREGGVGAGLVRAKTGTLTGVNTLAGTVVDADGRLLAFAFMTAGTTDKNAAQDSLDRLAAALADCGCHDSPSAG